MLPTEAPALSVLKDAFARGALAHLAVDWQFRYRPKDHLLMPLDDEDHRVRAAFDRAKAFTKKIHPDVATISLAFKAKDGIGNNLYLNDADEYGPMFWKDTASAFEAPAFKRYLEASSYDTLIISGLYVHDCQGATVIDALRRDYKVVVPTDMVVREMVMKNRNLSLEREKASPEVDEDVAAFYFRFDDDIEDKADLAGHLFGAKSYEIVRALGL